MHQYHPERMLSSNQVVCSQRLNGLLLLFEQCEVDVHTHQLLNVGFATHQPQQLALCTSHVHNLTRQHVSMSIANEHEQKWDV